MKICIHSLLLFFFITLNSEATWVGPNGWIGWWPTGNTPPGPFRSHTHRIVIHLVPFVNGSMDSRTGLVNHHLIECDPYLGSPSDGTSFVFADIDPKFIGDPFQSVYPGDRYSCYYDQKKFHAEAPPESPPLDCSSGSPAPTVGNPIAIASGSKIQKESDFEIGNNIFKINKLFTNYNSQKIGRWVGSWERKLVVFDSSLPENKKYRSKDYSSVQEACTSGFDDIKITAAESWMAEAQASMTNDNQCLILKNGIVIKTLVIRDNTNTAISSLNTNNIFQIEREDGSISSFYPLNGKYRSTGSDAGILEQVNTATNQLKWRYTSKSGIKEYYSSYGKLIAIEQPNSNIINFMYGLPPGMPQESANGNVVEIDYGLGNKAIFSYFENTLLSITYGSKSLSYTYNDNNMIAEIYMTNGGRRKYHYEDTRFPTYLTGITDERGKRYATWTYDAQGRAISSEHAGGAEKTLLSFNADGSTTVTNALNKQTIYRFEDIAGARRVVKVEGQPTANCAGANQNYTYTHEGWIASKTDWKGIKTTFQYNTLGQEISRTEAVGTPDARTITTEWHPSLYVKTKITEPDKQTIFTYDAKGHLLSRMSQ